MQKKANAKSLVLVAMKIDSIRKKNVKLTAFIKPQTNEHQHRDDFNQEKNAKKIVNKTENSHQSPQKNSLKRSNHVNRNNKWKSESVCTFFVYPNRIWHEYFKSIACVAQS